MRPGDQTLVRVLLGAGLILGSFQLTRSALHPDIESKIDQFIQAVLGCRQIVGINMAVVKGGEVLYTKGFGVADMDKGIDVTSTTLFSIASLSKAFTTTLLAKVLAEDGRYTWDTPVRDILGEDFFLYNGLLSSHATLRDFAAHTTGIPNNNYVRMQQITREELAMKMRFLEPTETFRSSHIYNNLMYGMLSYVTEVIGGAPWEDLMRAKIFQPLGMTTASFTHEQDLSAPEVAKPYLDVDEHAYRPVSLLLHSLFPAETQQRMRPNKQCPMTLGTPSQRVTDRRQYSYIEWGKLGGSGSVMTSAEDMAKWLYFQSNGGKNQDGDQVLGEEELEETHRPVGVIQPSSTSLLYRRPTIPVTYDDTKYGLAWRVGSYRGLPMVLHTGTSWGYGALLSLLPDEDLAISSSITGPDSGYTGRRLIHMYIMDLLTGEEPWLNLTTACTFPEPWAPAKAKKRVNVPLGGSTHLELSKYEGTYGNFGYGNVTVAVNDTALQLKFGILGLWNLHPKEEDTNEFVGEGIGHVWSKYLSSIKFSSSDGDEDIDQVEINFESRMPPVFIRDLQMADAPPPPNPGDCSRNHDNGSCQPCATGHAYNNQCYIPLLLFMIAGNMLKYVGL